RTISSRFLFVAAITRISVFNSLLSPILLNVPFWSTRSTFAWRESDISPISSRKITPSFASSNFPMRDEFAPVKAPFSYPNSSASSSVSGIAAQFITTNGFSHLVLTFQIDSATRSFPVPLSPVINIGTSTLPACPISLHISWSAGEFPTIAQVTLLPSTSPGNLTRFFWSSDFIPSARPMDSESVEPLSGLKTQSNAPNVIDSIRYLVPLWAVMMITNDSFFNLLSPPIPMVSTSRRTMSAPQAFSTPSHVDSSTFWGRLCSTSFTNFESLVNRTTRPFISLYVAGQDYPPF